MSPTKSLAACMLALFVIGAAAADCSAQAVRKITGTFSTPVQQGAFKFTSVRAVRVVNMTAYEGNFVIAGKTYPGSVLPTPTGLSMVWYYGVSGIQAGQALATLQTAPTYSGNITFFTRGGAISSEGTLIVTLQ